MKVRHTAFTATQNANVESQITDMKHVSRATQTSEENPQGVCLFAGGELVQSDARDFTLHNAEIQVGNPNNR